MGSIYSNSRQSGFGKKLLVLLILFFGLSTPYSYAAYQYDTDCAGGAIRASDVLAGALQGGVPLPVQTGGTWTATGGLTFSTNDENAIITGTGTGVNNYNLTWRVGGVDYAVHLRTKAGFNAPVVSSFSPIGTVLICATPYTGAIGISVANAGPLYKYTWTANGVPTTTGWVGSFYGINNPGLTALPTTYVLTSVESNGCFADLSAVAPVVYRNGVPLLLSVSANASPVCSSGAGLIVSLPATNAGNTPQVGISYQLQRDKDGDGIYEDMVGAPIVGNELAIVWPAQNVKGAYRIIGSGCATSLPMTGVYNVVNAPVAQTISITQAAPYCSGRSYTIQVNASELNVNYSLYSPGGALLETIAGLASNGAIQFTARTLSTGVYRVEASNGTCATVNMNNTLTVNDTPPQFLIAGGPACQTTGLVVTQSASTAAVNYTLMYNNGVTTSNGQSLVSTGGALTFANVAGIGTYTVNALSPAGCAATMLGSEIVEASPIIYNMTRLAGTGCSNQSHVFGLSNSEPGVTYTLFKDGVISAEVSSKTSAGGVFSFDQAATLVGAYTVRATRGACTTVMNGTFVISQAPVVAGISLVGTDGCSNDLKNVGLSTTQAGVTYELLLNGASLAPVVTKVGTGGAINFYAAPVNLAAGVYSVSATALNSCSDMVAGSITVYQQPQNLPFVSTATVCGVGNLSVNPGENGVTYRLLKDNGAGVFNPDGSYGPISGNGVTAVSFNGLPFGIYKLRATRATCFIDLSDVLTVEQSPALQVVTVPDNSYCANESPVAINVGSSQLNVDYQLYNVGSSSVVTTKSGTGGAISFTGVTAGTYQIRATTSSCIIPTSGNLLITEHPITIPNNNVRDFCSYQTSATLTGTPTVVSGASTGVYKIITNGSGFDGGAVFNSNNGTLAFDPSACAFGTPFRIEYTYTDGNGCVTQDVDDMTVFDLSGSAISIFHSVPVNPCQTDNTNYVLQGRVNGVNVTGTFSSATANLKNANAGNGTVEFNPMDAGNGTHVITFNYTANGCSGSASITVNVGSPLNVIGFATSYCSSDNTTYALTGNQAGGTFRVIDKDNVTVLASGIVNGTSWFNPSAFFASYGAGNYTLIYSYNSGGCLNELSTQFTVVESIDASFSFPLNAGVERTVYCKGDPKVLLNPNVSMVGYGSNFTGLGVGGVYFHPQNASVNISPTANVITHRVNNNGCITTATRNVFVEKLDVYFDNLLPKYCVNSPTSVLTLGGSDVTFVNADISSTISGAPTTFITDNNNNTANLDPAKGPGVFEVKLDFTRVSDGCKDQLIENVQVAAIHPADFGPIVHNQNICIGAGVINLVGMLPDGGTGTFPTTDPTKNIGVVNSGLNDGKATVNVSLLTPGTSYVLHYEYTNVAGCTTVREKTFNLVDGPVNIFNITGGGAYCADAPVATRGKNLGLSGGEVGVEYELLHNGASLTPAIKYTAVNTNPFTFDADPVTGGVQLFTLAGDYSVIARYGVTCEAPMQGLQKIFKYDLTLQHNPLTDIKQISCFGSNDGSVKLQAIGGSGSYIYSYQVNGAGPWINNPNSVPNVFVNLGAGTHRFSVTDLDVTAACVLPVARQITATINPAPAVLAGSFVENKKVGCNCAIDPTQCDGKATLTVSGGTKFTDLSTYPSGYQIAWPASVTSLSSDKLVASNLAAGSYNVLVTDAKGCTANINVVITSELPLGLVLTPPLATNPTANLCYGTNIATARVTASGGSGTYEFSLDATNNWLTDVSPYTTPTLSTGAHVIWVRDKNHPNCFVSVNVNIAGPASALDLTVTPQPETCNGSADGKATLAITGGVGVYSYRLDGGALTVVPVVPIISGITTGAHSIVVSDVNGCNITKSFGIDPANPISLTGIATPVSCNAGNDGKVTLTANPPNVNYVYSKDNGTTWQGSNVFSGLNSDATNSKAYSFLVKDNVLGCQIAVPFTVNVTQPRSFTTSHTKTDVKCFGDSNGSITLSTVYSSAPLPGAFQYSIDGGVNWLASPITGLKSGFYNVLVKDLANGCSVPYATVQILEPTGGSLAVTLNGAIGNTNKHVLRCVGATDGAIDINTSATGWNTVYTYSWRNTGTNAVLAPVTQDITALSGGTYEVTVTDAGGCTKKLTQLITEPAPWNVSLTTVPNTITNAASDIAIVGNGKATITAVTGGSAASNYTYRWYPQGSIVPITGTNNLTSISNLDPGSYYVEITDATDGCTYQKPFTISDNTVALNATVVFTNPKCVGGNGSIQISILGGSGTYVITHKKDTELPITINPASTSEVISAPAGNYVITITDTNGGVISRVGAIAPAAAFSVVASPVTYASCQATIGVIVSAVPDNLNYKGRWAVPAGAPALPDVATVTTGMAITHNGILVKGTYQFIVEHKTDPLGCTQMVSLVVEEPSFTLSENLALHKDITCNGGTDGYLGVTLANARPAQSFTYSWQNGVAPAISTGAIATLGDSPVVNAGNWTVTASNTNGSCSKSLLLSPVIQPSALAITNPVKVTNVISCAGVKTGSALVEVSGGTQPYTVNFTNGIDNRTETASKNVFYFYDLTNDTYTVTLKDVNGCPMATTTAVITAPTPLVVSNFVGSMGCAPLSAGQLSFDVTGGFIEPITNVSSYAILIEGDNGFSKGLTLNVDWDTDPNPYTFTQLGLTEGTYTVKVWDAKAGNPTCPVIENTVKLNHIYISGDVTNKICTGGTNNGTITNISVVGASSNVVYSWSDIGVVPTLANRVGLDVGTFTLTITDNDKGGCVVTKDFVITNTLSLSIDSYSSTHISCNGGNDGTITLDALPTTGDYLFSVNGGTTEQVSSVFTNLTAQNYSAQVRDVTNGCVSAQVPITLLQDPLLVINPVVATTHVKCFGENSGSFTAAASGGKVGGTYQYSIKTDALGVPTAWQDSPVFTNLTSGTYDLWVRNAFSSCVVSQVGYAVITEPTNGLLTVGLNSKTDLSCVGNPTGSITVGVLGGWAGAYSYAWKNTTTNTTILTNAPTISGLAAGDYQVKVSDSQGCLVTYQTTVTTPSAWSVSVVTTANTIPNTIDPVVVGNGTVSLNPVTGGSTPASYTYQWYDNTVPATPVLLANPLTTTSLSNLKPGAYKVVVTGVVGCSTETLFTITDASKPLSITVTPTHAGCNETMGKLRIDFTAGTAPFEYSIQRGSEVPSVKTTPTSNITVDVLPGLYTVIVKDATLGLVTTTTTINAPIQPFTINVGAVTLGAGCTSTINASVSASDGYSVSWGVPTGATPLANLPLSVGSSIITQPGIVTPGIYKMTVTNTTTSCSRTADITVLEPSITVVENLGAHKNAVCNGGVGYLEVLVTGRPAGHTYGFEWSNNGGATWSAPSVSPYLNTATAGTWQVRVTTADGFCQKVLGGMVVTEPSPIVITKVIKDISANGCSGDKKGEISLTINGGKPSYTVTLSNSGYITDVVRTNIANTTTFTGLPASTTYKVRVVDDLNCVLEEQNIAILEPAELSFNVINTLTCGLDAFNQAISVTGLSGGNGLVANYTYQWTGPDNILLPSILNNINDTREGTYTVKVTDELGLCSKTKSITVTGKMAVVESNHINVSCNGLSTGLLSVDVTGGPADRLFTYNWQRETAPATWVNVAAPLVNGSATINALPSGTYRVIVTSTSSGCSVTSPSYVITQTPALTISSVNAPPITTCNGDNSGFIELSVTGGSGVYYLDYNEDNVTDFTSSTGLFRVNNLVAGSYKLSVSDHALCTAPIQNVSIIQPNALALVVDNVATKIDCQTQGTGVIQFTVSGGNLNGAGNPSYKVELSGKPDQIVSVDGQVVTYSGLNSGFYTIKVTDLLASEQKVCTSKSEVVNLQLITISGTTVPNTCGSTSLNVGAIRDVKIEGASNSVTWAWDEISGDKVTDNTQLSQENLPAGTYLLNVVDVARGCTPSPLTKTFVVGTQKSLSITGVAVPISCFGANDGKINGVQIVNTTNYDYVWSGDGPVDNTKLNQSNLLPGSYLLTVTDKVNKCTTSMTWQITEPLPLAFDVAKVVENCAPYQRGITLSNATGGYGSYTYKWVGPGIPYTTSASLTGLSVGGKYTVTMSDINCGLTKVIDIPKKVVVTPVVTQLKCAGNTDGKIDITLIGGSSLSNLSYVWSKDANPAYKTGVDITTVSLSNCGPGVYTLTITDSGENDGSGACTYSFPAITLVAPSAMTVDGTISNPLCNGLKTGSINAQTIGGAGSYTYQWTTIDGTGLVSTNEDQTGLSAGTYTVQVRDANACLSTPKDFVVTQPPVMTASLAVTNTVCDGTSGSILTTPSGGSGVYTYAWSTTNGGGIVQGTKDQAALIGGDYLLKITDATAFAGGVTCAVEKTTSLTKAITVQTFVKNQSCSGVANGEIAIIVKGGVTPYVFEWTRADGIVTNLVTTSQNQTALIGGTYHLKITDSRIAPVGPCVYETDVVVGIDYNVDAISNVTQVSCKGAATGAITLVDVTGGASATYEYLWEGPSTNIVPTNRNQKDLIAGNYKVTISNGGCSVVKTYVITQPASTIAIGAVPTVSHLACAGTESGAITISVTGGSPLDPTGTPYYRYTWNGPSTNLVNDTPIQTNLSGGDYTVNAIDANGCVDTKIIHVNEPFAPVTASETSITHVTANGGNNGSILIAVAGGTGSKTIVWTGLDGLGAAIVGIPQNTNNPTGLIAGTYTAVVTDVNGCSSAPLSNLVVRQPGDPLSLLVTTKDINPCKGNANGEVNLRAIGGDAPYVIKLYNSANVLVMSVNGDQLTKTGLLQDTYWATITDANSNTVSHPSILVGEPTELVLTASVTQQVLCYQASTGTLRYRVSGGVPNASGFYKVIVTGPKGYNNTSTNVAASTDYDLTNLPAGSYGVRVIDDSGKEANFNLNTNCYKDQTVIITEPKTVVTVSNNSTVCSGESANLQLTVSDYPLLSVTNPLRVTLSDGTVVNLTSINTAVTVNPLLTTVYTVVGDVTDGTACVKGVGAGSATVTVKVRPDAFLSLIGANEVCSGGSTKLNIHLEGAGPWDVTYTDGSSNFTLTNLSLKDNPIDVSPANTTTYSLVSVKDASCTGTVSGSVLVTVNPLPSVTMAVPLADAEICQGEIPTLNFSFLSGTPDYSVAFSEKNSVSGVSVTRSVNAVPLVGSQFSLPVTPSVTMDYQLVSVTDAKGCMVPITNAPVSTITVNANPGSAGVITGDVLVCQGAQGIVYSVGDITGATSYAWTVPAGVTIAAGNGTKSISVNYPKTFTSGLVTVSGVNACNSGVSSQLNVNNKPLPLKPNAPSGPIAICAGATGLLYSTTPVANANEYRWSIPAGLEFVGPKTGSEIQLKVTVGYTNFGGSITVTPVNTSCGDGLTSDPLVVTITPLPVANAGFDKNGADVCSANHQLNATLLVGNAGKWTVTEGTGLISPAESVKPNAQVTGMSFGTNTFKWTVTNPLGCSSSDEVILTNEQVMVSVSALNAISCDGSVTVSGTSVPLVNTGSWSFTSGGGFFVSGTSNTTQITNLNPDNSTVKYTVTQNQCSSSASLDVLNNKPSEAVIYDNLGYITSLIDLPCGSTGTTISASPAVLAGEVGTWRIVSGSATLVGNVNSPLISISNVAKGETVVTWTLAKSSCSNEAKVIIRNNSLIVNAGLDKTICNGNLLLNGTVPPVGTSGSWSVVSGLASIADASKYNAEASGFNRGANTLRWTVTKNGCASSDDVVITNNTVVEQAKILNTTLPALCGSVGSLYGNAPSPGETGVWTLQEGSGVFVSATDPLTKVQNVGYGTNKYKWTISYLGCSSSVTQTVINNKVDIDAGGDQIVCDASASLKGNTPPTGTTGMWQGLAGFGGGVIISPTNSNTVVGGLSSGDNGFVWTIKKGDCVSSDEVHVVNKKPYSIDSNGNPIPINAGDDKEVKGSNTTLLAYDILTGSTGKWTLIEGGATIVSPNNRSTDITNLQVGPSKFRWTVTNGECTSYDDVVITNGEITPANAGVDQLNLCVNQTTLKANTTNVGIGQWSVKTGKGTFANDRDPESKVTNIDPGTNVYVWTLYYPNNVNSSDEVVVVNNSVSVAYAGVNKELCYDHFALQGGTPLLGDPKWSVISGGGVFVDDTNPITTINGLAKGANVLKLTISKGTCKSESTVVITNNLPTDADAGIDKITICADSLELFPNTPTFGVGEWIVKEGSADGAELKNNWAKKLAPGLNILEWRITSGGCPSSDFIEITNNQPSKAFAGGDKEVCVNYHTLSAGAVSGVQTGKWELISGAGVLADATLYNSLVTGLGKGRNRFRWTVNNQGCSNSDDVEIVNNFIQSVAGPTQVICSDKAVMDGNIAYPGSGSWSVASGSGAANFTNNTDPYTTVSGLDKGNNTLVWTIKNGICPSSSTVIITNDSPTTAIAGENVALCLTNSSTLSGNVPEVGKGIGAWSIVNGSGSFSSSNPVYTSPELDPNANVTNLAFGSNLFRWTITKNACSSFDDVELKYNRIDANAGAAQTICSDETLLQGNNASPGTGVWTVSGVGGATSQAVFTDNASPTTKVSSLGQGVNALKWTISYQGCVTESSVDITNNSPDAPYAGNKQTICVSTANLDATAVLAGKGSGLWKVLTGSANVLDPTSPNSQVTGLSKGDNVLSWVVTKGTCVLSDEVLIVNNQPSAPYSGADEVVCSAQLKLKATPPLYGKGLWTIIQGSGNFDNPTSASAVISNLAEGTNTLRWTLTQGQCSLFDDIVVTNNTPIKANAGPDIQDCKDWAQLDANRPTTGTSVGSWSLVSGKGTFDKTDEARTIVRNLGFGENILLWTIQKDICFSTDQVKIFMKIPDQAAAGVDRSLCEDYVVLNANEPVDGVGTWSVISGMGEFSNPNLFNTMVTNVGFGENIYKWTIAYGSCTTEDVMIAVSNKAAPFAGEDAITYSSSFNLQGSNPGKLKGSWSVVAGKGVFADASFFNTTVSGLQAGKNTFRWTIETDGCVAYDDVTLDYKVVPEGEFIVNNESGCYPLSVNFTNYSVGGSMFLWEFGDGTSSSQRNVSHVYMNPGVYNATLTITGPDGVNGFFSKLITVYDHPVADFKIAPTVVYVPGDLIKCYNYSKDATVWNWDFGDGNASNAAGPDYEYTVPGIYSVTLTVKNKQGCEHSMTQTNIVEAKNSGYVKMPDAFKPRPDASTGNGDLSGRDDTVFKPKYRDVESYNLQIFNRWGQLIFESNDVNEGWNGMYNDQLSPQEVYVWKVKGKFVNGREFRETGSVLLVR